MIAKKPTPDLVFGDSDKICLNGTDSHHLTPLIFFFTAIGIAVRSSQLNGSSCCLRKFAQRHEL